MSTHGIAGEIRRRLVAEKRGYELFIRSLTGELRPKEREAHAAAGLRMHAVDAIEEILTSLSPDDSKKVQSARDAYESVIPG